MMDTKRETDLRLAQECVVVWKKKAELAAERRYNEITLRAYSCPLCQEYLDANAEEGEECYECPIYQDTLGAQCCNTPYGHVTAALHKALWSYDKTTTEAQTIQADLQNAIAAEIKYLKTLCTKLKRPFKAQNPESKAC